MALILQSVATEMYGYDPNHFCSLVNSNKRRGVESPWYKTIGTHVYIDTTLYEKNNDIQDRARDYNTTFMYWLCMDLFKNESRLAEYLSYRSNRFKDKGSWISFLRKNMWLQADNIQSAMRYTMQIDFLLLSTRLIYNKIKDGHVFINEWE